MFESLDFLEYGCDVRFVQAFELVLVKFDEFVGVGELSDHDLLGRGGDEILPGGRVSRQGAGLVGENLLDFRDLLPEF